MIISLSLSVKRGPHLLTAGVDTGQAEQETRHWLRVRDGPVLEQLLQLVKSDNKRTMSKCLKEMVTSYLFVLTQRLMSSS